MITRINSRQIQWCGVIQEVQMVLPEIKSVSAGVIERLINSEVIFE